MNKVHLLALMTIASLSAMNARAEKPKSVLSIKCTQGTVVTATGPNAPYTQGARTATLDFGPNSLEEAKKDNFAFGLNYMVTVHATVDRNTLGVGGGSEIKCNLPVTDNIKIQDLKSIQCTNVHNAFDNNPVTIEINDRTLIVTTEQDDSANAGKYKTESETVYNKQNCTFALLK